MERSYIVHRWAAPGIGSVNTYWIETPSHVIVIDGQRELSKARRVKSAIDATGKPIVAVVLTHPHPDHFGGIGIFAPSRSGIPVYGSRTTRSSIAEDRFGLVKASHDVIGDDFPADVTLPNTEITDGMQVTFDGVEMVFHELAEGEAECLSVLYLPRFGDIFCSDAVQDRMTAFLLEGRSEAWLTQLDRMRAQFPAATMLYPGHGEPGAPAALITRQRTYLMNFRHAVERERRAGAKELAVRERVMHAMSDRYPHYVPVAAIPDLLERNVEPLANELVADAARGEESIAVIGTGAIGAAIGKRLAGAGRSVIFGATNPDAFKDKARAMGAVVRNVGAAVTAGEIITVAFPFGAWPAFAHEYRDALAGKIVIDATNPDAERDGAIVEEVHRAGRGSLAYIAALMPRVRLVKTFNTMRSAVLAAGDDVQYAIRLAYPVAGDDARAVESAALVVHQAGFDAVIAGDACSAARFDAGTDVFDHPMTASVLAALVLA